MARPVLGATVTALLALSIPAASCEGLAKSCSGAALDRAAGSHRKDVREFDRHVRHGPFYAELVRRFGQPGSCDIGVTAGSLRLAYTFRTGTGLEARRNAAAEYSEQRLQIEGMDTKAALALLKRAEKDAFGADGCGILWDHPAEEEPGEQAGSRQQIYRGETCNCQGRILYRDQAVVGLVLSSAC